MSNTKIIKAEIKELHECINTMHFNLGRVSMGSREYEESQQEAMIDKYSARIAELEQKLDDMK